MAIIAPFKGLTYNFHTRQDLANLVTPPYDVISGEQQEKYYQADPHNVIRLVLGKKKIGDSDWDNRYTRAADYLARWESEETLIRSREPCIYITSLTYHPGGGEPPRTRWGIIALVRIEEQDSRVILPHERTFSAHRDDRLMLMKACNSQLSQIFSLFEDPDNTILGLCKEAIDAHPLMDFDYEDDTRHRMWILQNPPLFKRVADALLKKTIFIADGHHRYETSRNFRNFMRARHGRRPANRSYEYVMMYLSNMNDKGLTILPSHRLVTSVPGFQLEPFLREMETWFHIKSFHFSSSPAAGEAAAIKERLRGAGITSTGIAFFEHGTEKYHIFSLKEGAREEMGDDLHPSLRKLDVLVLSRFMLQRGLGFSKEDLDDEKRFHYESNMETALSQVASGEYQITFLLNSTKADLVKEVASNSLVMPRKSTYFYPKVLSGLVFNKIDPYEIIQVP